MQWQNVFNPERLRAELAQVGQQKTEIVAILSGQASYNGSVLDLRSLERREQELEQRIRLCSW